MGLCIGVIFCIECNCDDDEELDIFFFYVMFVIEDDMFDIYGNDVENCWYVYVEMMECILDIYNDIEYKEYFFEEVVVLFLEWGVLMNYYDIFCLFFGVNSIDVFSCIK